MSELWDWADVAAIRFTEAAQFSASEAVSLILEDGFPEDERSFLAGVIRYGAEMAERDLLRNARYYSSGIDCIEEWGSLDDARKDRELAVHLARVEAQRRNEWPDWVEPIEYGYLVPVAKATMVQVGEGGACNYRLEPVR